MFKALPIELQLDIFSHLADDRGTLFSAMQVSRGWYKCCVEILWQNTSARYLLCHAIAPHRRQYYANAIQKLCDPLHRSDLESMHDLHFPRLREVCFSTISFPLLEVAQARMLAGSQLRVLSLVDGCTSKEMLQLVNSYCPKLRELLLDTRVHVEVQFLVKFLQSLRFLDALAIGRCMDAALLATTFDLLPDDFAQRLDYLGLRRLTGRLSAESLHNFLVRCVNLQSFSYSADPYLRNRESILDKTVAHLPKLTHLSGVNVISTTGRHANYSHKSVESLGMKGSTRMIAGLFLEITDLLTSLTLLVEDNEWRITSLLGRFGQLKSLRVYLDHRHQLRPLDLMALQGFPNLQTLTLGVSTIGQHRRAMRVDWIDDGFFDRWIMNFPALQKLELEWFTWSLTVSSLRSIAYYCPELRECTVLWIQCLHQWSELQEGMFPHLEMMVLGCLMPEHVYVERAGRV
jgi:hypothetical protein